MSNVSPFRVLSSSSIHSPGVPSPSASEAYDSPAAGTSPVDRNQRQSKREPARSGAGSAYTTTWMNAAGPGAHHVVTPADNAAPDSQAHHSDSDMSISPQHPHSSDNTSSTAAVLAARSYAARRALFPVRTASVTLPAAAGGVRAGVSSANNTPDGSAVSASAMIEPDPSPSSHSRQQRLHSSTSAATHTGSSVPAQRLHAPPHSIVSAHLAGTGLVGVSAVSDDNQAPAAAAAAAEMIAGLQSQVLHLAELNERLSSSADDQRQCADQRCHELEKELNRLRAQLSSSTVNTAPATMPVAQGSDVPDAELVRLRRDNESLRDSLQAQRSRVLTLQAERAVLCQERSEASLSLQTALSQVQALKQQLQEDRHAHQRQVAELQARIDVLSSAVAAPASEATTAERLDDRAASAADQSSSLTSAVEELRKLYEATQLELSNEQRASRQQQRAWSERERALELQLRATGEQLHRTTNDCATVAAEREIVLDRLQQTQQRVLALQQQVESTQAEVHALRAQHSAVSSHVTSVEQEEHAWRSALQQERQRSASLQSELHASHRTVESSKLQVSAS